VSLKSFCWNRFVELSTGNTNSGREERWQGKKERGLVIQAPFPCVDEATYSFATAEPWSLLLLKTVRKQMRNIRKVLK
jgi:hypothetical protein